MDKELHRKILEVMMGKKDEAVEEAKKPLHPNQQKLDVHEPEKDELTAKDFEMLRAGKKAKMKEDVEQDKHYAQQSQKMKDAINLHLRKGKTYLQAVAAARAHVKEEVEEIEEEELDEAGMPSSVARHKQNIANMSDKEFAQKYSHLDDKGLKSMAWSHLGTKKGGPGTPGHSHYVNRMAKGKAELAKGTNEEVVKEESLEIANLILSYASLNEYFEKEHIGSTKNYHVHSVDPEIGLYHLTHKKTGKKTEVEINDNYPNNTTRKIKKDLHGQAPNSDIHAVARKINKHLQGDEAGEMRRELKNEEVEELEEARFKKGQDIGKPGKNFAKIAKAAAAKYGSEEAGKRVAGAVLKKVLAKEEVEINDDADETILVHTPIEYELAENYMFGDYLTAAKSIVGEEKAIELANYAFNNNDTDIFVEQFLRSDIEAKVKAHEKMGHKVSMPKYSTKSGKPYAEYVVTDKEGVRRKYIHHGANRKTENMGPVGKRDDE